MRERLCLWFLLALDREIMQGGLPAGIYPKHLPYWPECQDLKRVPHDVFKQLAAALGGAQAQGFWRFGCRVFGFISWESYLSMLNSCILFIPTVVLSQRLVQDCMGSRRLIKYTYYTPCNNKPNSPSIRQVET